MTRVLDIPVVSGFTRSLPPGFSCMLDGGSGLDARRSSRLANVLGSSDCSKYVKEVM